MLMKFDMHIHTDASPDGMQSLQTLRRAAEKKGLSGFAVCDHDRLSSLEGVIHAAEYSTQYGHMLVYFLTREISRPNDFDTLIKEAHEQNALVFAAHPFAPHVERPPHVFERVDGIEVYNARIVHSRIKDANARALELARSLGKPCVAGSDAHCPQEVGASYIIADINPSESLEPQLRRAILSREIQIYRGCSRALYRQKSRLVAYARRRRLSELPKQLAKFLISLFQAKPKDEGIITP